MSKGFTLLELLIVIAILAILTTVVVLVLNPAEYLAQARDSQRMSDLSTLNSAISLYLSSISSISWTCNAGGASTSTAYCTAASGTSVTPGGVTICRQASTSTLVNGNGWLPINFTSLAGGSPLAKEPIDPSNAGALKYAYNCNATANTYELDGKMESAKYKAGGNSDVEGDDGGDASSTYEIGTDLTVIH